MADGPAPATEAAAIEGLLGAYPLDPTAKARVRDRAVALTRGMRVARRRFGGIDEFLQEFGLTTKEGVALMCLAEALLRIPDAATADALIEDKIGSADWDRHLGHAESVFVNAATWGLMLTGRVVALDDPGKPSTLLRRLVARAGEPAIRLAMRQAVRILGRQFVMGETIEDALDRARDPESVGYRHSFDMLGEGARTLRDADGYMAAYEQAIDAIGAAMRGRDPIDGPGISVKLSALHPRYEEAQRHRVMRELVPRIAALARRAAAVNMSLTIDAEEAERLDLSLDVIEAVLDDRAFGGWQGFGLAVQAYQMRAPAVIDRVIAIARTRRRRLMVRLVKGAYWDSEIKKAQERGFAAYPVFTRKAGTDLSYIVCAAKLLAARDVLYPCFATHNAHTVAAVIELAAGKGNYEFQRLHGMGEPLYHQLVGRGSPDNVPCRVYAPVGTHRDLLAYLVRRLLENGANTSFVNRIVDEHVAAEDLVRDPAEVMARHAAKPHPRIPLPIDMFRPARANSAGLDLSDRGVTDTMLAAMQTAARASWRAAPLVQGAAAGGRAREVHDPANLDRVIGTVIDADASTVDAAHRAAAAGFRDWVRVPVAERAAALDRAADLIEAERTDLMTLIAREAGRTVPDALSEVREAADFCRYYAAEARRLFAAPAELPGPTGERNTLALHGRGAFACISPWNFPLAIFTGQIAAALVAGNAVLAKPAEQTPLIAARAVALLHRAGVPTAALHLLPGDGTVGAAICDDARTAGVAFTGSVETAWAINRGLAARRAAIVPLIAETGGQNAMLVDSSALPEQVVDDAITSAFRSAGQRCSALRVLFVQEDVADRVIEMIAGAARELVVGDPMDLATDVGPVIDAESRTALEAHVARMAREARLVAETPLPSNLPRGHWFAPRAYEIDSLSRLTGEVFGPVLHIVRYAAGRLDAVLETIEATGFGLTLGVHSRIDRTVETIVNRLPVGNAYVNRNMIGAVVGVQPFGGQGLSGTGPKAGGPHYLPRFATERTLSINTAAAGGNATLVSLGEG
ncbi:bifunctional proline dehydrogenase/L-glutamate gamma-semialdehyde dehydrogenase PutA [Reyranella sp. CPCC 100927]|uniref:bifunctional proline dehydrogenase/L-glutamate gamma-semialdehyde dehydrogenase PutA n=1 Tax=Reyranella sp. CPCC 100927 TaxID=2599616 RepID=UPI0011B810BC|nr:bifunctional proline dehydrogenase/L-glutamate gamma-semialdehyde dehydrogenase PutA [Reyranella sp. CPCC 100927]TWT10132.1 bifunctional proline dehydrogenase/L-glutamate gamma-semialdehyde dehydrogenase PutA [Reyranella sp. CPCC 100927]